MKELKIESKENNCKIQNNLLVQSVLFVLFIIQTDKDIPNSLSQLI